MARRSMAYLKLGRNIKRLILMLIILTVVVHMVIIFHIKGKTGTQKRKKLVRDHEEALCNFRINRSIVWNSQIRYECPRGGIVTVFSGGGLEAQMWAYSSVLAVSRVTSLEPFVPICMHSYLSRFFHHLSVYPLSQISDCDIALPNAATDFTEWSGENQSLVLPVFSCLSDTIVESLDEVIREFKFKEYIIDRVNYILKDFNKGKVENPVFVGVPLPNNWESMADGLNYPDETFYAKFFNFIRHREHNNSVFVVVSTEEVNRKYFPGSDVFFFNVRGFDSGLNVALVALCNISVLGFEGVGLWGALLSKGETFLFESYNDNYESYIRAMPRFQIFE